MLGMFLQEIIWKFIVKPINYTQMHCCCIVQP